jgi:hypothetical protein
MRSAQGFGFVVVVVVVMFAALSFTGGGPARAKQGCDAQTVAGTYGYVVSGTNLAVGLVSAVGQVTADGHGNLTGADTLSAAGTILRRTITGSYTVNAACTGQFTFTDNFAQTIHADVVLVHDGAEIELIETDPGTVITGNAKRL